MLRSLTLAAKVGREEDMQRGSHDKLFTSWCSSVMVSRACSHQGQQVTPNWLCRDKVGGNATNDWAGM